MHAIRCSSDSHFLSLALDPLFAALPGFLQILVVLHGIPSIIGKMLVTTRRAGPPSSRLRVPGLEHPIAEGHGIPDVMFPIYRMYFVTGTAGSAFVLLVDVNGVQIHIAIPEPGKILCPGD